MSFLYHWLKVLIGTALLVGLTYGMIHWFLWLFSLGTGWGLFSISIVLVTIMAAMTYQSSGERY